MRTLILATCACLVAAPALALQEPTAGKLDARMVTANYDPSQVYAVHVPQGQTLAVTVSPDEIVTDGFGADGKSLRADLAGNTVMLWSGDIQVAPRSMFIRTRMPDGKARTYALLVDTRPPNQADLSFTFTYPAAEAAKRADQWRAARAFREQKATQAALDAASGASDSNVRYVLQGKNPADWDLLPTREVSDNGTDTHFHFPGSMRVPIIYAVNPDGKEAVVEPTFNSKTGVATVHQLARAFHLRDGDAILCVFNRAFDPIGRRSATGTISSDVERVTRDPSE